MVKSLLGVSNQASYSTISSSRLKQDTYVQLDCAKEFQAQVKTHDFGPKKIHFEAKPTPSDGLKPRRITWSDEENIAPLKKEKTFHLSKEERREKYESALHSDVVKGTKDPLPEKLIQLRLQKFDREWDS